jgi:hypothetical protein
METMTAQISTTTLSRSAAADGPPTQKRIRDGICDSKLTTLVDAESLSAPLSLIGRAVAQMISTDGGSARIEPGTGLHVPYVLLRDITIGLHRLCPNTDSDFKSFMDEACIEASTAVLIGPRHVLTTAHSVRIHRIISHQFVFNRTKTASHVRNDDAASKAVIPPESFYTARRLVAYAKTQISDWAVFELDRDVEGIEPLGIGRWKPTANAHCFGHPLGLPLKYAEVHPTGSSGASPTYLIGVDAGSGGSGSPIIQSGEVIGIIRGAARIDSQSITTHADQPCIDPALSNCSCPQPFTPSSYFAPCIPDITGW